MKLRGGHQQKFFQLRSVHFIPFAPFLKINIFVDVRAVEEIHGLIFLFVDEAQLGG
jgi:hypothetical protein